MPAGSRVALVSVLSNCHVQAVSTASKAKMYLSNMTKTIPENKWQQWEEAIQYAESVQHDDPVAMDILGTQQVDHEERSESSSTDEASYYSETWIQLAINIEEKQFVIHLYVVY